jgi:hypothetical protein
LQTSGGRCSRINNSAEWRRYSIVALVLSSHQVFTFSNTFLEEKLHARRIEA